MGWLENTKERKYLYIIWHLRHQSISKVKAVRKCPNKEGVSLVAVCSAETSALITLYSNYQHATSTRHTCFLTVTVIMAEWVPRPSTDQGSYFAHWYLSFLTYSCRNCASSPRSWSRRRCNWTWRTFFYGTDSRSSSRTTDSPSQGSTCCGIDTSSFELSKSIITGLLRGRNWSWIP